VIVLPLASAALVYALIERPFEAWRARRYERSVAASKLPAPSDLKIPENVEPIPGS
jgi:peptidoglycan/LPS O-acetylase OafA/YrhL